MFNSYLVYVAKIFVSREDLRKKAKKKKKVYRVYVRWTKTENEDEG